MTEKNNAKFKMQFNDENQDMIFEEDPGDIRSEKLNKRITIISILAFCLSAVLIFAVYFNMNKKFGSLNSAGKAVSDDIEARLSSVSDKQVQFEGMLGKKIESVEKTALSLQKELKDASTAIKYIRSARKSDNKSFKDAIDGLENKLKPLDKDLKDVISAIKTNDKKLSGLGKEIADVRDDLNKTKGGISKLLALTIDRETLDKTIDSKQKIYEEKLKKMALDFQKKIESLQKKVTKIEKDMPPAVPVPKPVPEEKPVEKIVKPQPGTIIEQDIK
jgi:DNA repair exonuclease SbcCD ATPase subunit